MWECPECGAFFAVASASSVEDADEIIGGVECPECGEFISNEELEQEHGQPHGDGAGRKRKG